VINDHRSSSNLVLLIDSDVSEAGEKDLSTVDEAV